VTEVSPDPDCIDLLPRSSLNYRRESRRTPGGRIFTIVCLAAVGVGVEAIFELQCRNSLNKGV
jgi:hypothetical protein